MRSTPLTTLRRLLRSFLSHPRASLERRTRWLAVPPLRRLHRYRLSRKVDLGFLSRRPPETYPPDFSDLWFLYQTVRKRAPRTILEFGSGASTVVLAQALHDNTAASPGEPGHLYSIDDQRRWADVTTSTIPPHLRELCEVRHIPTVEIDFDGVPCFRHAQLPDVIPDMIYLDGPTFSRQRNIAVDILDIERDLLPDTLLIIDGRGANTEFLKTHLSRPFHLRYRGWYDNTVGTLNSRTRDLAR
jgi:hypothetical protein